MPRTKESLEEKRAISAQVKKETSIDSDGLMDNLYRIANGQRPVYDSNNPDPSSLTDTSADRPENGYEAPHINFDHLVSDMGMAPTSPIPRQKVSMTPYTDFGDLTPLITDIAGFKFSQNRQEELEILRHSIHAGLKKISANRQDGAIKRIVDNTRSLTKGAEKFYKIKDGGVRVEFSVLTNKYSMLAIGQFYGNESMAWAVDGNDINGYIMRRAADGSFVNVSGEFKIKITKGWKG